MGLGEEQRQSEVGLTFSAWAVPERKVGSVSWVEVYPRPGGLGIHGDVATTKEVTRTEGGALREAVSYALGLPTAPDFHTPEASHQQSSEI